MLRKIINPELTIVILMVASVYALAYGPIVWNYLHPLPERVYLGYISYPIDTLGNLSIVQRGYLGYLKLKPFISSALDLPASYVKTIYLVAGNLARIIRISPLVMFKILTLTLSVIFITSVWLVIAKTIRQKWVRITAMFLALFSTGITIPGSNRAWEYVRSDSEVFQRSTILQPHYMFGAISTILALYFLSRAMDRKNIYLLILASIIGFLCTFTWATCSLMLLLSLPVFSLIKSIRTGLNQKLLMILPYLVVFAIISLLPYAYLAVTSPSFDKNLLRASENVFPVYFSAGDYLLLVGPVLIPAIISVPAIIGKGPTFLQLVVSWLLVHPLGIYLAAGYLGINQIRFIQTPFFVLYGITAASGLYQINQLLSKFKRPRTAKIITFLSVMALIIPSFYTYRLSFSYNLERSQNHWNNSMGYPLKDEYDAMLWLGKNATPESIVLSDVNSGTMLLALTPLSTYSSTWFGASQLIAEAQQILTPMISFYSGFMNGDQSSRFLADNRISYVYFGPEERGRLVNSIGGDMLPYGGLTKIFENPRVVIYRTADK